MPPWLPPTDAVTKSLSPEVTESGGLLYSRVEAEVVPAEGQCRGRKMSLVLASPTYGPVDPNCAKRLRTAVMHAASHGVTWYGDVSSDRQGWESARNSSAAGAIESGADGVVWVDSDMVLDPSDITRLISYSDQHDFLSGVYFQRRHPFQPLIYKYDAEANSFRTMLRWPTGVIFPCDGVGFGIVYTSTKMLKELRTKMVEDDKDVWWSNKKGWFGHLPPFSEDLSFCRRAAQLGYQPYVDTAIQCGHMADPETVTLETFKAKNPLAGDTGEPLATPTEAVNWATV